MTSMSSAACPRLLSVLLRKVQLRADRRFDQRFGLETWAPVTNPAFEDMPESLRRDAVCYLPSGIARISRLIRSSGVTPDAYQFVDLGCGKGRVLFIADQHGFQSVTGIEADKALCVAAQANLEAWRTMHPETSVRVIYGDARTAPLPEGNLFIFMYNPFVGEVLDSVAARLAGLARAHRRVVIAYSGDANAEAFVQQGVFSRERLKPLRPWLSSSMSLFRSPKADCKSAGQP